jgi:predicted helicase
MPERTRSLDGICNLYVKELYGIHSSGIAEEPSYYHVLKEFLESIAEFNGKKIDVIISSKRKEGSKPDLLVRTENQLIIGHIEAKDVGTDLDRLKNDEQLKRYRKKFPNLIFTNFSDLLLFKNGKLVHRTTMFDFRHLGTTTAFNCEDTNKLLQMFISFSVARKVTALELASELATRTIWLKDAITEELQTNQELQELYSIFRDDLITSLTEDSFADLYAQTISYGLLFAKMQAGNQKFDRTLAYSYIPQTIPLLQRIFYLLTGPDLPKSLEWLIDDLARILSSMDMEEIKKEFHTKTWTDDPVVYFYETFLSKYNPTERNRKGVYFTPPPVVSYIISSLHLLLQQRFSKEDGFADPTVTFLDPAAGTLTFFTTAIKLAFEQIRKKGKLGTFNLLVRDHILKNYYAFELLLAPYVVGHFKANIVLNDLGYTLESDERIQYFLTNTLEIGEIQQKRLLPALAKESERATEVKEKVPILVIAGNPPYSVRSENKSKFIEELMELYKQKVKDERNIQPLSNDYLKFIRFVQWKIEQIGKGMIGLITDNSYLTGLIHRGVREELLETFDEIYILNLHGNSQIKETCPDGRRDENVFQIREGVAILILVKLGQSGTKTVFYCDKFGSREEKYSYLEKNSVMTTQWTQFEPKPPMFYFEKVDDILKDQYYGFVSLADIFEESASGIKTHRDHFVTDTDKNRLLARLKHFAFSKATEEELEKTYNLKNTGTWNIRKAKEALATKGILEEKIQRYLYRPFDIRYVYYDSLLIDRPRPQMDKFLKIDNVGLLAMRQVYMNEPYTHFLVTNELSDMRVFLSNRGASVMFPLYRAKGISNIREEFRSALEKTLATTVSPEELLDYVYAVLHSTKYRATYDSLLRKDYPHIPFPSERQIFAKMASLGRNLVEMHLFKTPMKSTTTYPSQGSDSVDKVSYDSKTRRLYINDSQYFGNITEDVWGCQVGGYRVLEKYLKERLGAKLSSLEIDAFGKIAFVLKNTIDTVKEIDSHYETIVSHATNLDFVRNQKTIIDFPN